MFDGFTCLGSRECVEYEFRDRPARALVWVYEGGDGLTIDAFGEDIGELGSPRALLGLFPPHYEAVLNQVD